MKNRVSHIRVAVIAALIVVISVIATSNVYAASPKITTERVAYPAVQTQKSFSVKGLVTVNKKVEKAKVGVVDADGKWVISKTRTINAKSFKLSTFSSALKFKEVGPGLYSYKCTVTVSGKSYTAFNSPFAVYKSGSSNVTVPDRIPAGSGLSLEGKLTLKPVIEKLTIGIAGADDKLISGHKKTVTVNKDNYNLADIGDNPLDVASLAAGTYKLRATATILGVDVKLLERSIIIDKAPVIEQFNVALPDELTPGNPFTVSGSIGANAPISKVKLGIVDSNDKWLYTGTATPNSDVYDLNKLNSKMLFKRLDTGKYRYRCILTILGKEYTVFNQTFRVLSVSTSGITYPSVLIEGKSFSLAGIVKSNPNMSAVTVGLMQDGSWVKDHYVTAKKSMSSYDIAKNADSKISFGNLKKGIYNYRCEVTVLGVTRTAFDYEFEITDKVNITLKDVLYPPDELGVGKAFSIGGKITSNVDIAKVRIGIVDGDEVWRVYKDFTPKTTSWDIAKADSYITFGTLPVGSYKYRIVVTVGGKEYTKVDHSYKVVRLSTVTTKSQLMERIEQLKEALDGKYFTTDGKKASGNVDSRCNVDNVLAKNTTVRNLIKKYKGDYQPASLSLLPQHYALDYGTSLTRGYSCCGFANFAEWYIMAEDYRTDVGTVIIQKKIAATYTNASRYVQPGDIIRLVGSWSTGHSAIVISVKGSGLELLDCNSSYYDPVGDKKASRVCTYTLVYSKMDNISISRATNSPYL